MITLLISPRPTTRRSWRTTTPRATPRLPGRPWPIWRRPGTLRSRRILDALRELSRHAAVHQRLDEVAHLRQQIGTLVLTS
ncbi:MAG: hypothetical protein ACRDS9_19605 [Pseudonocardiaceae bacterium]